MAKDDPPVTFGGWLKQHRRALDLTQDELARRVGCSVFAMRKIEAGERRPSKQLALLLAAALEIPQEDRGIFLRIARGELNLERLRPPAPDSSTSGSAEPSPVHPVVRLPVPPTPLIGRETDLAAIGQPTGDLSGPAAGDPERTSIWPHVEERIVDERSGRVLNANVEQYKILGSKDVPVIVPLLVNLYAGKNNAHARGIGEPAVIPTAAAVANAVSHALGARVLDLPITPQRVLATLARKNSKAKVTA